MAIVTWLGEDSLHVHVDSEGVTHQGAGPSFTTWGEHKFVIGQPVEVKDIDIIRRAKGNKFFKVEDEKRGPGRPPKVQNEVED